jgi:hypothetical protein
VPDSATCTCALVDVSSGTEGFKRTEFGLRDPNCPIHPAIPPEVAPPIYVETPPNKADAAWERLLRLRDEARALGIEVDEAWPIQRLIEEIATKS